MSILAVTAACSLSKSPLSAEAYSQPAPAGKAAIALVSGPSMLPSLHDGDKVQILPVLPDTKLYRGQLVLVRFTGRDRRMVKLIFAIPGDTLLLRDSGVRLNDRIVRPEGWPLEYRVPQKSGAALKSQLARYKGVLPANQYVIFGDNPLNSQDSLDYGFVARSQITAIVQKAVKPYE